MRVLVTGASGFIGSALVRRLDAESIAVRGSGRRQKPPHGGPLDWRRLPPCDDAAAWRELLCDCEVVVHLAALAHQSGHAGRGRWQEFQHTNVELTRAVARASAVAGVRRVVLVSSLAAMCVRSVERIDEDSPCAPEDDYGRSKLAAEQALEAELREAPVDWCILRPPLVYGPGNPGNMARLLRLIDTGLPLPFGSIRNQRSFLFVDNLVDALLAVVRHPGAIRATYLLGDGSDFATPELVAALAHAIKRSPHLLSLPLAWLRLAGHAGDVVSRYLVRGGIDSYSVGRLIDSLPVNDARFRRDFAWHPPVEVQLALRRTGEAWAAATQRK